MKSKLSFILALIGLITLSFTFINNGSNKSGKKKELSSNIRVKQSNEPAGGFTAEDKF